jgi:hypothetical protein
VIVFVVSGPGLALGAESGAEADPRLATAIAERVAFGLDPDTLLVAQLLGSKEDVGSATWGIVATADEVAALDLPDRVAFEETAVAELIPKLQEFSTFAGAYFDQTDGGRLVIRVTRDDGELNALLAADAPQVLVRVVDVSQAQLETALDALYESWAGLWECQSTSTSQGHRSISPAWTGIIVRAR